MQVSLIILWGVTLKRAKSCLQSLSQPELHDYFVVFSVDPLPEELTLDWLHANLSTFAKAIEALGFEGVEDFLQDKEHPIAAVEFFGNQEKGLGILAQCQLCISSSKQVAKKALADLAAVSKGTDFSQKASTTRSLLQAIQEFLKEVDELPTEDFELNKIGILQLSNLAQHLKKYQKLLPRKMCFWSRMEFFFTTTIGVKFKVQLLKRSKKLQHL
jgi:hypothetical protein